MAAFLLGATCFGSMLELNPSNKILHVTVCKTLQGQNKYQNITPGTWLGWGERKKLGTATMGTAEKRNWEVRENEMRHKSKVENKLEAVEIYENVVLPSVPQRVLFPKETVKFHLRKP